jgi:tetratricopeptide (TPR) repeat protein
MKPQNIVILVVVTNIVSISSTFLIMKSIPVEQPLNQKDAATAEKDISPLPQTTAVSQPVMDVNQILALFDIGKEDLRKKTMEMLKKIMRDVPPYIGAGTKGYSIALTGDYQKGLEITKQEINNDPESVECRYTLAWIYAKLGDYNEALGVCNSAVMLGPKFNKLRYIMGWVYAKQGMYEDALRTCDMALGAEPYSAMLYYAKGRIEDMFGHNDKAIESYLKAISIKSDFYEAYVFLGILYTELGRYDDAIKAQQQAISLNRFGQAGYLALGLAFDKIDNYQEALTQFNNAVTLNAGRNIDSENQPLTAKMGIDDAIIYNRIGIFNAKLGSYDDALAAFNRAIMFRQGYYPEAYRGLVLTYLLLNDRDSALKCYEKLKKLDADIAKSLSAVVDVAK